MIEFVRQLIRSSRHHLAVLWCDLRHSMMLCKPFASVWYLQVSYTAHTDVCYAQYLCLIEGALVQTRTNLDHVHGWNHRFDYHEMLILSPAHLGSIQLLRTAILIRQLLCPYLPQGPSTHSTAPTHSQTYHSPST